MLHFRVIIGMIHIIKAGIIHLVIFMLPILPGGAAPYQGQHAAVELISDISQVAAGKSFHLGLRFNLEPHWHIYWSNPGASGLPPEVEWALPEGFSVGKIQFPAPERFEWSGLVSYGHEGAPLFIVPVQAPDDLKIGEAVRIRASAFWLICNDTCIADEAVLDLQLPVAAVAGVSEEAVLFEEARLAQGRQSGGPDLLMSVQDGGLEIEFPGRTEIKEQSGLYFFPETEGWIDPNAEQTLLSDPLRLRLEFDKGHDGSLPGMVAGILQIEEAFFSVEIQAFGDGDRVALDTVESNEVASAKDLQEWLLSLGLSGWLVLAFLGGLLLNIMPCVLPVLSLKVLSLLKHTGQSRRQAILHGLFYTAGVVGSFLALSGVLFALRAAGHWIGWGYQLQSPGFTLALAVLFFVFAFNLFGVFEMGAGLVGADSRVSQRNDWFGSFGMGVLAAVVGAPCMGPMVASVSGIAIQAPVGLGLMVFAMMGLGLASPFLLLAVFPQFITKLPKPGLWMETFKQMMGFLLLLAVIFLASVIGSAGGVPAMIQLLLVLFVCAVAVWIYGRWGALAKPRSTRRKALISALLLILAALVYGTGQLNRAYHESEVQLEGPWATWSPDRVEAELTAGRSVFVDFTASWCLICQANKIPLRSEATEALFESYGITSLEADWTLRDPVIAKVLHTYGRAGVPLYLLIQPGGSAIELPQNLTFGIIEQTIKKAFD